MFRLKLFGRDTVGKSFQCDLRASFATKELAVEAAERAAARRTNGSLVTLTNYRITGSRGLLLLDVEISGSQRRLRHKGAAA
jgi:hypothetical protein